jgi:hypothetical protein
MSSSLREQHATTNPLQASPASDDHLQLADVRAPSPTDLFEAEAAAPAQPAVDEEEVPFRLPKLQV